MLTRHFINPELMLHNKDKINPTKDIRKQIRMTEMYKRS